MGKVDQYREHLPTLTDWDVFLMAESRLPGARSNLELLQAVADVGSEPQFRHWLRVDATPNTPSEFLLLCGVVGLGKLLAEGDSSVLTDLRHHAADSRWRVREAVCIALQRWGDVDMDSLITEMRTWSSGGYLEKRAAAAALCEPRLLKVSAQAEQVLLILDCITDSLLAGRSKDTQEDFKTLRKALGYCWSVAAVAHPTLGKALLEKWLQHPDPDIGWIMRENLKKNRLLKMDAAWVAAQQKHP